MKAKECAVMAGMMIGCFGCSEMLPKMDASRPIQDGGAFVGYMQRGKQIDRGDMADKLALEPDAAPHVQNARVLKVVSTILAVASGALIGWPLGQWSGGDSHPNWELAAIGGGAFAIALPLGILSDSSMNSAVEAHNKRLAAAPVVKSTSAHTWKPGERAGAPSTPRDAFGFVFGISKTDAAAVCQKAGHQWSEIEGVFHCSGTPSTAITGAPAQLEFTAAGLSTVEIVIVPPKDAAGWTYMLRQSEGAMAQLYGNPTQRNFVVPDDCKPEASFLGCVADGKVTGNSLWFLDGGYVATLTIVAAPLPSPSTIHVRILLRQPPKP